MIKKGSCIIQGDDACYLKEYTLYYENSSARHVGEVGGRLVFQNNMATVSAFGCLPELESKTHISDMRLGGIQLGLTGNLLSEDWLSQYLKVAMQAAKGESHW